MGSFWKTLSNIFRAEMSQAEFEKRLRGVPETVERLNPRGIRIVALLTAERDRELLARVAAEHQWVLYLSANLMEALETIHQSKASIVLCDHEIQGNDWRAAIHMINNFAEQKPYTILVSRLVSDSLWYELISYGGHDLIARPLCQGNVVRAMELGWSQWTYSTKTRPMLVKHYL